MYKNVAKRILAVILTFCMVGTMPDTALLASSVSTESMNMEVDEADITTATEDSEEKDVLEDSETPDRTETETEIETETEQEEDTVLAPITDQQQDMSVATAVADAPMAREGEISLASSIISKPEKIPSQVRGTIPTDGGFVSSEIVGLDIYNTETNAKLTQRLAEGGTNGDYTVTASQVTASSAKLTVQGVGGYTGTITFDVAIGKDIKNAVVSVTVVWGEKKTLLTGSAILNYEYEGRRIDPKVEIEDSDITVGNNKLTEGTHYKVILPEEGNLNVGPGKITIEGMGTYAGKIEVNFTIEQAVLRNLYELTLKSRSVPYSKKAAGTTEGILPGLTVRNRKTDTIVYDSDDPSKTGSDDFQFSCEYNKNVAVEASVRLITGSSGNCTGNGAEQVFEITKTDVNSLEAAVEGEYTYTGGKINPGRDAITIKQGGVALDSSDFDITGYGDNISKKGTVTIQGKGNYTGERTLEFTIADFNLANIPDANIEDGIVKRVKYTGSPIEQEGLGDSLTAADGTIYRKDTDYIIAYENNTGAGEASVVFRAKPGSNCIGEKRSSFVIYKDLSTNGDSLSAAVADQIYTGQAMKPSPTVVDDPGTAWAKTLIEGVHYEIEYDAADDYTQVTDHSFKIKGLAPYYEGEKTVPFDIIQRSMDSIVVEFKIPGSENNTFTGTAIKPDVIVYGINGGTRIELPSGDFQFAYKLVGETEESRSINVGEYRVEVRPNPSNRNYDYNGTPKTLFYTISQKELKFDTRKYDIALGTYEYTYTGSPIEPGIVIRDLERNYELEKGTDYTYNVINGTDVGTATVVITGTGNYRGEVRRTFDIVKKDISAASSIQITLKPDEEYVYTGEPVVPVISKLEIDGRVWDAYSVYDDFNIRSETVDGLEAVNAGTGYTFTIEGKNNYKGKISSRNYGATFDIVQKDISDALNVRVKDVANQEYTGSPVEPEVVITYNGKTLVKGIDYTTASVNNTNKYPDTDENAPVPTVTITGMGNYKGTREMTFKICESIRNVVIAGLDHDAYTYTSLPCEPKPTSVMLDGEPLLENRDYILEYEDNIESNYRNGNRRTDYNGQPKVRIVGTGKYGGKTEPINFRIDAAVLTGINASQLDTSHFVTSVGGNPVFTGSPVKPALTISYKPGTNVLDPDTGKPVLYQLDPNKDFDVNQINDVNAGNTNYNLQIGGKGNFYSRTWFTIKQYKISPKPITSSSIKVEGLDTIDINARPINISGITFVDTERDADGSAVKQGGTYALKSSDYTMTATGLDRPGTAKIKIAGKGNYTNSREVSIDIPGSLADAKVVFTNADNKETGEYLFTGFAITPKIEVTCGQDSSGNDIKLKNTDYDSVVVGNARECGTYQLVLTGKGAYEGTSKTVSFTIKQRPLSDSAVKMSIAASVDYDDGRNVWPKPTLMLGKYQLKEDVDYKLIPEAVCFAPTAISGRKYNLIIQAIEGSNFTGAKPVHQYTIGAKLEVDIVFEKDTDKTSTYTGKEITPEIRVYDTKVTPSLLEKGRDYEVSYSDNINVGTVTITVAGLGDPDDTSGRKQYYGTRTVTFQIVAKNLADRDIQIASIAPITYTGSPILPEPSVTWEGNHDENGEDIVLEQGVDFQFRYDPNVDAGTDAGKVTINPVNGNKNFTGSKAVSFTINQKDLTDPDVVIEGVPDQVYIGAPIIPELNIHWGEDSFHQVTVPPTGYTVKSYGDSGNVEVGAVEMTIEGQGNYKGIPETILFNIVKVDLNKVRVEYSKEEQYTGKQIKPPVTLKYDSTDGKTRDITMTPEGWGYVVTYGSNERLGTRSGKITVTANPDGNCEGGPLELAFDIVPRHITDSKTIEILYSGEKEPEPQYYNPKEGPCVLDIGITFVCDGYIYNLIEGEDYSVTYEDNDRFGTATVTIEGRKNFDDRVIKKFKVYKRLSDWLTLISVTDTSLVYNGTKQKPTLNLQYVNEILTEGTDYELVYGEADDLDGCINAGDYTGKIVGINEYGGEIEFEFTIRQRDISHVTFDIKNQEYTGSDIFPPVTGMDEGIGKELLPEDFTITNAVSNKEIGTAIVRVEAAKNSNYTGTKQATFEIVAANIEKEYMIVSDIEEVWAYNSREIEPEIELKDSRRNPDGEAISARADKFYVLKKGIDYDITYDNDHIYPGEVTMRITGRGHYTGTLEKHFRITASLEDAEIDPIPPQPYTGEEVRPELTVRLGQKVLVEGTDYVVTYSDNIDRSTEDRKAQATIIPALGSLYTGSKTAEFMISRDIAGAEVQFIGQGLDQIFSLNFPYTGGQIRPVPAVLFGGERLEEGVDYVIDRYMDNIEVGSASIVIRGLGGYDGETTRHFNIIPRSITQCNFNNIVDKVYSGRETSQDIVVSDGGRRLQQNRDYTVSYIDNRLPGIATIEVSGINNYGGSRTLRYQINVPNMTAVKAQGNGGYVDLSWSAVPGAQGYAVYDLNNKLIAKTAALSYRHSDLDALTEYGYKVRAYIVANGTTYYGGFSSDLRATTTIATPNVSLKAGKKKMTVSWQRIKGVNGYEIYRSTKKAKGYKKVKTASRVSITSYTNKKLTSKTKYYYRVRAYKTVNGRKIYGSYSSPKSAKTK